MAKSIASKWVGALSTDSGGHTPGPWTADARGLIWRVELKIADTCPRGLAHVAPKSERPANARLIAAAPDLLAALTDLLALAEHELDPRRERLFAGQMVRARAAIAKARGGS